MEIFFGNVQLIFGKLFSKTYYRKKISKVKFAFWKIFWKPNLISEKPFLKVVSYTPTSFEFCFSKVISENQFPQTT